MNVFEREDGSSVEFVRTSGNSMEYYDVVKSLNKFLQQIEESAMAELEKSLELE